MGDIGLLSLRRGRQPTVAMDEECIFGGEDCIYMGSIRKGTNNSFWAYRNRRL
jgi:hypothetical protein